MFSTSLSHYVPSSSSFVGDAILTSVSCESALVEVSFKWDIRFYHHFRIKPEDMEKLTLRTETHSK